MAPNGALHGSLVGRVTPVVDTNRSRVALLVAGSVGLASMAMTVVNWLLVEDGRGDTAGALGAWGERLSALAYLGVVAVGAVVISRSPVNLIGWIFCSAGLLVVFGGFASEAAAYLEADPGRSQAARLVAWLGAVSWWGGAVAGLTSVTLLYPDGRLPSRRWRVAGAAAVAGV